MVETQHKCGWDTTRNRGILVLLHTQRKCDPYTTSIRNLEDVPDGMDAVHWWGVMSRMHVFLHLSPLSLDMIRWLVMDHSMHNDKLKPSRDRE
jgi:hypothetical protein